MLLIIAISTFVCISLAMLGAYWLLYRPQSAATERLKRLGENSAGPVVSAVKLDERSTNMDLTQRLAAPVSRLLPPSAAETKKLQQQLMQAGFRSPGAAVTYRAIQVCTLAGLPALVALSCALLARPLQSAVLYILFALVIGLFMQSYKLRRMISS